MDMQGDGWPLGLQPLNVRVELVRNCDLNGSVSFNTLLTGSPTSSPDSSSSDLDTEVSTFMCVWVFIFLDISVFYVEFLLCTGG